jgi:circadian clock protein KaiC
VSSFIIADNDIEVRSMIMRIVDFLKSHQITGLFTSLSSPRSSLEQSSVNISSLIDTGLLLQGIEVSGERNRGLYILKSRGMAH